MGVPNERECGCLMIKVLCGMAEKTEPASLHPQVFNETGILPASTQLDANSIVNTMC